MNHNTFDICYCCGRIIGYAGSEFSNGFCSVGCEMADDRPSKETRQQNYDKSYEEFEKKVRGLLDE